MRRQVGVEAQDLPHAFADDGEGEGVCLCGRPEDAELHSAQARETASEHSTLERQTGS